MTKEAKKKALTELAALKKSLKGVNPDLDAVRTHLNSLPLFNRFTYESREKGELRLSYSNMTLTIYIKNGNIILDNHFDLWNESGVGYVGSFTDKTLQMECSDGLD